MATTPDADGHIEAGTVIPAGIRTAPRARLAYRDAWVAFAALKYPQPPAARLTAELTRQRVKYLREVVPVRQTAETTTTSASTTAVGLRQLPANAALLSEQAHGIFTGGNADATPVFQVIFDPNAPSDAALWSNLHRLHPDMAVRWLPINYFGRDSAALAATLLDATNPAAALAENFWKVR